MMKHLVGSIALAAVVAACGAAELADSPHSETAGILSESSAAPESTDSSDGVVRDAEGRPLDYELLGQKLPVFEAAMAAGSTFDSAEIERWTVIAVWGAWCAESLADGPYAEALSRAIAADPDLDFVTLHVPQDAARATPDDMFGKHGSLEAYFESVSYTLPVILDTDGSLREALKIRWTPTYLVVSPDGVVRGFRTDLSVDTDQPVKTLIKDIARLRGEEWDSTRLTISPDGVASLGEATPFTVSAVEKAFPGFIVIPIANPESGASSFEVRPKGSETARFIVESDWSRGYVATVRSREAGVRGPIGEVIGTALLSQLPEDKRSLCADGEPVDSRIEVTCPDPGAEKRFTRVYRYELPHKSVEPVYDEVQAAQLVELRYTAELP